jgi:hypothetical protein
MEWCKVDRAPTAVEIAQIIIHEYDACVGIEGPSSSLRDMANAFLQNPQQDETKELLRIAQMQLNPKLNQGWFERVKKVLGE